MTLGLCTLVMAQYVPSGNSEGKRIRTQLMQEPKAIMGNFNVKLTHKISKLFIYGHGKMPLKINISKVKKSKQKSHCMR